MFWKTPHDAVGRPWRKVLAAAAPLLATLAFAQPAEPPPLLAELHRAALATDPAAAAAHAQLRAAEQRVLQARAAFGPTAAATLSHTETRYYEGPAFQVRPFRSQQAAVQVTQPLLRTALLPALQAAQAQLAQAQAALDQAQADATQRLVEAAFDVLKARDTLMLTQAQRVAVGEQLLTAQRSFRIGTAPATDVREAEAKADAVAAQVAAAEVELELRQQVLGEIVGQPVAALLGQGLASTRMPHLPPDSVLAWLADAQAASAQVRQAQLALDAAEAEVRKAWQAHAPTADLTLSHTMSSETGTVTSFFPRRGDSHAAGLTVNIPLFASGATQAKVAEAMALRDKARADLDTTRRNLVLQVRQAFAQALSAISQAQGLETAVRSQDAAMRANRRAYEVGLKVNAEVLESQSRLFEARRDLSRARYDAWVAHVKLRNLAGRLSSADVAELDGLLGPQQPAALVQPQRGGPEGSKP